MSSPSEPVRRSGGGLPLVAAVDFGGSHIAAALADLDGRVLTDARRAIAGNEGPDELIRLAAEMVRGMVRDAGGTPGQLGAVGVGVPGMVDTKRGVCLLAANLAGWANVPVATSMRRRLGVPVRVENDANLAALGETWRGAGAGHRNVLFIALGTGIGAGVVIEGRIYRGSHNFAGEIGFSCLGPQYLGGDYRLVGCLESLAAAPALVRRAREALGDSLAADATAKDVSDMARSGHAGAARLYRETATFIGIAVANAVAVLDPAVVVVGGGMSREGGLLLETVREVVYQLVPTRPEVTLSALGEDAQLHGGLLTALELVKRARRRGR